MPPKLDIQNVTQTYREAGHKLTALQNVNLTVQDGEFVTIIGPSGSGKTTLLEVIVGLQQPNKGTIAINGKVMQSRLGHVAYMPQDDALLPWRTVIDNVVLGPEVRGQNRREAVKRAHELLPLFGLEGFDDAFPTQLSGGMRQRAAFLRTFMAGQDIILLDEPFGALDAQTRRDLHEWLLDIWQHFSYTILFVTHDVEEAIYLGDRVVVLSERPGTVKFELTVPFARPRLETVKRFSPEMVELEARLFEALRT